MEIYVDRLKRRTSVLGNHYRKYITIIEMYLDGLLNRLEHARKLDRIHLWTASHDIHDEMVLIGRLGASIEEKRQDLACYFALQLLQMNLNAMDALTLELTTSEDKLGIYKNFMLRVGHDFRHLTSAYMQQLLKLFLPEHGTKDFVFLGVGTRSDQDDIDVGVVDRGEEGREKLNRAIGRMNSEMLKRAISLHFHLSEHVGSISSYSASIEEYDRLLEKEIHDFVIITEMLGAARILGDRKLFFEFRRRVTGRYYYNPDKKGGQYHEGYLRGIVGETRSFMFRELSRDRISPKGDGLRMIKAGLFAAKTIYNLRQVNAWAMLEELKKRDRRRRAHYENLERPLTFLEVFRYLYQLLIAQEEEIYLEEQVARSNLSVVAEAMGYRSIGAASATDFLLTDYYKYIRQAKDTVKELLPYAVNHLESITIFGKLLRHKKATDEGEKRIGNLAIRFLKQTEFFRGTRFWDDIITVLGRKEGQVLKRLVKNICSLEPEARNRLLRDFIDWGWNSFIATFSFIILLHEYREDLPDCRLFHQFNELFFKRVRGTEEEAQRLSIVFTHYPELVHRYSILLTESQQKKLFQWLDSNVWDRELLPARNRLRYLIKLHYSTSKYFRRTIDQVLGGFPEYMNYMNDFRRLRLIGKGIQAEVERAKGFKQKLINLQHYYRFEYLRVGLDALAGAPLLSITVQFNEFSDTYLRLVFDACKQKLDERQGSTLETRDLLGVFIAGGQGQMQAFDDDYDLIILLNSEDPAIRSYCVAIIRLMHREIVRCGILPHYRLAEFTGAYICSFNELKVLLSEETEERFIDKSQLLGARMIVGSNILQRVFEEEILRPFIHQRNSLYTRQMLREIAKRREHPLSRADSINIKEGAGGLRDIEMLLFICRALFGIKEYSNYKLLIRMQSVVPEHAALFRELHQAYDFLRHLRTLGRLTVAAEDDLNVEYIENLTLNIRSSRPLRAYEFLESMRNAAPLAADEADVQNPSVDSMIAEESADLFHNTRKTMQSVVSAIDKIIDRVIRVRL